MASLLVIFGSLKKYFSFDKYQIDNNVFRLHYKLTVGIFVCCSTLVTLGQFFGDPIACIFDSAPKGSQKLLDTYCWIQSTYTFPSRYVFFQKQSELLQWLIFRWRGKQGQDFAHPGVGHQGQDEDRKYYKYYQWVVFFLTLQSLLFYLPRWLWKKSENGKIKMLIKNLQEPLLSNQEKKNQMKDIVHYILSTRGHHSTYAFKFFAMEALNFINTLGQMYFIDLFLDHQFIKYGWNVLSNSQMEPEDRIDPMVFPKVTKCTFHLYGFSGTIEKLDGLCVLPLNIINEKIFIFIWFWLIFVAFITGIHLVFR